MSVDATKAADPPTDETQPLLSPPADEEATVPPTKRSTWATALYIIAAIAAIVGIALFIKAFIDRGEFGFDLGKALKSAIGGGFTGAAEFQPLRTIMNYQYRYGTTTTAATKHLYNEGGWSRYYQGLTAALVQGPGILALLDSNPTTKNLPRAVKSIFISLSTACFRIFLTPVDTLKTTLQTQGKPGLQILKNRIKMYGIGSLWYGALATAAATFVGNYPWSATYSYLDGNLPVTDDLFLDVCRSALMGFAASVVSDTVSNSLRVVKTYRQVNETRIGYLDAAAAVIASDGLIGLFGRGLKTRILANGLQGLMFSVLWRYFLKV
ncbi:mitochondrial carrier domain-containing protein [Mycena floridula]|nr:mitochondrial carrier domain-containing protein [Mycena floridula]